MPAANVFLLRFSTQFGRSCRTGNCRPRRRVRLTISKIYLRGDVDGATELMGILAERIDADDRSAVVTYRLSDLTAAAHSPQTVTMRPAS